MLKIELITKINPKKQKKVHLRTCRRCGKIHKTTSKTPKAICKNCSTRYHSYSGEVM